MTEMTPANREGMRALSANPFMQIILERLALERLRLEGALKNTRFSKVEDVNFVQSGVFWTGWLERELARLSEAPAPPTLDPTRLEEEAFKEIDSLLVRVGVEDQPQAD
jgi:hypothetical protein